ncbi:hypothetical protein [Nonomuraea turcica]|uniref:hypothetical protein n=1 Tax=Nonomuraea sp. G32 TaxID=3067274 RepID=UPI00273C770A|nr:hypothetical protein [Nonomuraea sp. G32]MDP4501118.1 hypothetical protein [Nonomuraea sp. G32]
MKERTFRTQGGGTVTWTHTRTDVVLEVGPYTCSGCRTTSRPVEWTIANKHALACCQIP